MRTLSRVIATVLTAAAIAVGTAGAPATADTEGCVSRGEYDNTVRGLSQNQIAFRYDTNGNFLGTGDQFYRRSYNPCWADGDGRKVVVWYDLDTGLTDHWDVRDFT